MSSKSRNPLQEREPGAQGDCSPGGTLGDQGTVPTDLNKARSTESDHLSEGDESHSGSTQGVQSGAAADGARNRAGVNIGPRSIQETRPEATWWHD